MNGERDSGILLGGVRPQMPEVIIYPLAQVDVAEGGCNVGDATHYLRITLPANGRELRIPFNRRSLIALSRATAEAVEGASPNQTP